MKSALYIVALVIGMVAMMLGPWYLSVIWIVLLTAAAGWNVGKGLMIGGVVMALVWLLAAVYFSLGDENNVIGKTAELIGGISKSVFILITTLVAFITGLLAGWLGSAVGLLFKKAA